VLTTCGIGASLLALTAWVVDVRGHRRWSVPLETVGVNPLFLYVFAGALSMALDGVRRWCCDVVLEPALGDYAGSLAWALLIVLVVWTVGWALRRGRVYIKI
jgi:predicted acyltransferase